MKRSLFFCFACAFSCLVGLNAQETLPKPTPVFQGKIMMRATESTPWWPQQTTPPTGAPNVLIILLDDAGFGATSTFGGPIPTPAFDRLAARGLRYTQFHTTALCSPTRAALITGRNHHSVHTGCITEMATGYPGYDSLMGKDTATIGEICRLHGYNTAWIGKNHNVPDWQTSQAGPFDLWPTALGFEYFYGFFGGDTSQWTPAVYEGIQPIEPYFGKTNYIFNADMADKAIGWIRQQKSLAPSKPFLVYYSPGATHAPHHVPQSWIDKFQGQFAEGWDRQRELTIARQKEMGIVPASAQLTPRPEKIRAWNSASYSDGDRNLMTYMMQIYAGFMAQTDYEIGRVLDAIRELNQEDNTLVIAILGDNGSSAEGTQYGTFNELISLNYIAPTNWAALQQLHRADLGGPRSYNHFPIGWTWAMDTPFQWTKQVASHYGGTRNPLIISWPKRIKDVGGIRSQWHHTIDVVPTILECMGVPQPTSVNGVTQKPIEGVSMAYSFDDAAAPSHRQTQYFEMFGNRAIYNDGWIACTTPATLPFDIVISPVDIIDGYAWELYHVADDFSQANNLASQQPEKLKQLQALFYSEAAKYNVLPLDNRKVERLDISTRPVMNMDRSEYVYLAGMKRITEGAAPDLKNRSFTLKADIVVSNATANGVLAAHGGYCAGWSLYVKEGRPVYCYNYCSLTNYIIASASAISPGRHTIGVDFAYDGGGLGRGGLATLLVDGQKVAEGRIGNTAGYRLSFDETLDIGEETGSPVSEEYQVPFRFTDQLDKVTITLKPISSTTKAAIKRAALQGAIERGLRD